MVEDQEEKLDQINVNYGKITSNVYYTLDKKVREILFDFFTIYLFRIFIFEDFTFFCFTAHISNEKKLLSVVSVQ